MCIWFVYAELMIATWIVSEIPQMRECNET